jgi:hypothetical protein
MDWLKICYVIFSVFNLFVPLGYVNSFYDCQIRERMSHSC